MKFFEKSNKLNKFVFKPIFERFGVDEKSAEYMISYYLNGINAIITEWIKGGCKDEISFIEKFKFVQMKRKKRIWKFDNFV